MADAHKQYMIERSSSGSQSHDDYEMQGLPQMGGTQADEHDMRMLGREQVLNVSQTRYSHPKSHQ